MENILNETKKIDLRRKEYRQPNKNFRKLDIRNKEITELYKTGNFSLEALGEKYGVTRERIRQVCKKEKISKEQVKKIMKQRFLEKTVKKYGSLENYAKSEEQKQKNRLIKLERKGKWNLKYDCCIECGTTERPHSSHGRCSTCAMRYLYHNSPRRKELMKKCSCAWRLKNIEKVKIKQHEYFKKYLSKPENKKRFKEVQKIYSQKPEVKLRKKEYAKKYYKRPEVIDKRRIYIKTEKYKLRRKKYAKEYWQRPEMKIRKKEYNRLKYLKRKKLLIN